MYLSRKYLDYEEKYVLAQSKLESVSSENTSLVDQVTKLTVDLVKAQDCLFVLEKNQLYFQQIPDLLQMPTMSFLQMESCGSCQYTQEDIENQKKKKKCTRYWDPSLMTQLKSII